MDQYGHKFEKQGEFTWCKGCGVKPNTPEARTICEKAEYVHVRVMRAEIDRVFANFGRMDSPGKIAKKIRRLYGRGVKELAREKVDRMYKDFEEHLKPKPAWCPKFIWAAIGRIVLTGVY